jgi:hypothetical protein
LEATTVKANDDFIANHNHRCRLPSGGSLQVGKGLGVLSDIQSGKLNAMCGKILFHVLAGRSKG